MWPHAVLVHPSLTDYAAVAWRSPVRATLRIDAEVVHVSTGRGVDWSLQVRRGRFRQRLAVGTAHAVGEPLEFVVPGVKIGPLENVAVEPGDLISLLVGAREGDSTDDHAVLKLELATVGGPAETWSLSREVSPRVLAGNPHDDGQGRPGVWNFYSEPVAGTAGLPVIPAGSLLARWLAAPTAEEKGHLARSLQQLLTSAAPGPDGGPDAVLYRNLTSLGGPFFAGVPPRPDAGAKTWWSAFRAAPKWGLDPARYGRQPDGSALDPASLAVEAPAVLEVRLPAELFAGTELVTTARILPAGPTAAGTAQARLLTAPPPRPALIPGALILARPGGPAWSRLARASAAFSRLFPAALCYTQFTPVDETMTLEIYHRDDGPYCDLMLTPSEKSRLDRLWDELHYVSQDTLALVDVCEARKEQDDDQKKVQLPRWPRQGWAERVAKSPTDTDYAKILVPLQARAAAFRQRLAETQRPQFDAVLAFADQAYRRPLAPEEKTEMRGTYDRLRHLGLPHEAALRLTLARVLVSPTFLYRLEMPHPGVVPAPVGGMELASRLSYFLWSSAPDAPLRAAAASGQLSDPRVLVAQARRLAADSRVRRLATEFGCEWLRIHDFDQLNDKSARAFPAFAGLRGAMYEETIRFLTDLFQSNEPVLNLLDADYTFLNEALARHYGIPGVSGPEWRRVEGIKRYSRGGILAQGTVLAKESAASRTSPILRGSWIVEVILGTKLPSPPANVPQLPEDETLANLTVRQLTERHTSDPRCAGCHARFNSYGYALENFDGIGRWREKDLGNRPIEARARLADGTPLDGFTGLRAYLVTQRRQEFLRQFCKKLLGYALGRSVLLSDEILLQKMQSEIAANHYRVDTAVEVIVLSKQFQEMRGRDFAAN